MGKRRPTIPAPRNGLVSYAYYRTSDLDRLKSLRLIGDSGAHSANTLGIKINDKLLADWITKWRHRLAWAACLDVINDPEGTWRGFRTMHEVYGIEGVPSLHFGTDPREMDRYADYGVDFMGLGGMVGKSRPKAMRWLVACLRYARDNHPDMRFHGWGLTSEVTFQLPFYSVDSSSWSAAWRFGRLHLRHPRTGKSISVQLDGRHAYDPKVARLLRDHYGTAPSEVAECLPSTRNNVVRVAALSASVAEQQLRRTHGPITPPSWGQLSKPQNGPNLHLADSDQGNLRLLSDRVPDGPHVHLVDGSEGHMVTMSRLGTTGPHLHLADCSPSMPMYADLVAQGDQENKETP